MKWKAVKEIEVMHYCEDYQRIGWFNRSCKRWRICEHANGRCGDMCHYGCDGKFYDKVDWESAVELGFITADDFVS